MCFVKQDTLQGATDAYNAGETSFNGMKLTNDRPTGWGSSLAFANDKGTFVKNDNGQKTVYFNNAPNSASVVRNGNNATYMPPTMNKSFMPGVSENFNPRVIR